MNLTLDADGCPTDAVACSCLKMLAQRTARLVLLEHGAAIKATRNGRDTAIGWIDASLVQRLGDAGWLAEADATSFVLSTAGRTIVRAMKSAPSPADAASPLPPRPNADVQHNPDSPLAWLRARRNKQGQPFISQAGYDAGERLRNDFHRAGMSPRLTVDWAAIPRSRDERRGTAGSAHDISDGTAAAQDRVRLALASIPPELSGLVMDVCCFDKRLQDAERHQGMPQRSAHFMLDIALNALARHYGLLPSAKDGWRPRAGTRHWGSQDYRPKV